MIIKKIYNLYHVVCECPSVSSQLTKPNCDVVQKKEKTRGHYLTWQVLCSLAQWEGILYESTFHNQAELEYIHFMMSR